MAIEMKKNMKMNNPVYLGMSILDISKLLMYEFWYDYIKLKYQDNAKLCYMYTKKWSEDLKVKIFMKILLMMLKNGLTHQTKVKMVIDHFQENWTRKKLVLLRMN